VVTVSAGSVGVDDGDKITVPSHDLQVTDDGQRVRLEWWHSDGVRARALFNIATADDMAVLVSLDAWPVSQRSVVVPDWCDSLDHIPDGLLATLSGAGYTPAERQLEERSVPVSEFMERDA
jgi:hypothetical protein